MPIDFLKTTFSQNLASDAIIWKDQVFSYDWLLRELDQCATTLQSNNILPGSVVALKTDYSPYGIALFLALIEKRCIVVPLTPDSPITEFEQISQAEISINVDSQGNVSTRRLNSDKSCHPYFETLRTRNHPGLILFSSGSTGVSKAAVHDMWFLLDKFKAPPSKLRTIRSIVFLLFDHIGGVNTMFAILSNGGCMVLTESRDPDTILDKIDRYNVDLLPTTPTFINLMLMGETYKRYSLRSLKRISYGTEPMVESTLKRLHQVFPDIKLTQTYGLSELGILRSQSKASDSLWVKIGGEQFKTRIVDGILQIKSESAMLGYLNAPSPFTDDGWFDTQDSVEVDGEYIKILGRKSDLINTGGLKVYPAEIENEIQQIPNIAEVAVYGEPNSILGTIVCAKVSLVSEEADNEAINRIKNHCYKYLDRHKVPMKISITTESQHNLRYKKIRKQSSN